LTYVPVEVIVVAREPGLADIPAADLEPSACFFEATFEVVPVGRDPGTLCGEAVVRGPQ
jgi:hypothetical protein